MISFVAKKIFGTKNARVIKGMRPIVEHINALEAGMQDKSDAELRAMTAEFRHRLDQGATLDDLLPEAFAVCREAGRRVLAMRHFDVQLIGGMVLHRGGIAEMKTGEGKTLVATLPVYLNALAGKGVHVVTVNDYLARRDAEWMGRIYKFLGMSVGIVVHGLTDAGTPGAATAADITYGTNTEFGFDYLRDNMKDVDRALRPARAELRDRRRGRLDPDRRGAHAAHHLGPGRGVGRPVPEGRRDHPRRCARTSTTPSTRRRTRRC